MFVNLVKQSQMSWSYQHHMIAIQENEQKIQENLLTAEQGEWNSYFGNGFFGTRQS